MTDTHRVIYVAGSVGQAYALRNLLEECGIEAYVTDDIIQPVGLLPGDLENTTPRVVVRAEDAEDARRIALAAEADIRAGVPSPALDELERQAGQDAHWPACPSCGRPRLASCPVCETAGTHFDEAFLPEGLPPDETSEPGDAARPRMVICPTCDEPFAPQFPPRCEWCGHRFADSPEPAEPVPAPAVVSDFNGRVVLVVVGLVVSMAALVGWFYYILHRTP